MLSKGEREYLVNHHLNIIDEHKKAIRWHENAIKNNNKRIIELERGNYNPSCALIWRKK